MNCLNINLEEGQKVVMQGGGKMTKQELLQIRDILTGREERYNEMGWPDENGEYDISGFPLPI